MRANQLGAGTVFEVKCLFAIDAIAAVYRADRGGAIEGDSFSRCPARQACRSGIGSIAN
jgi:hypothetical protein